MKTCSNLQKEIERMRQLLNEEAGRDISGKACYEISVRVDNLITDYLECKELEKRKQ